MKNEKLVFIRNLLGLKKNIGVSDMTVFDLIWDSNLPLLFNICCFHFTIQYYITYLYLIVHCRRVDNKKAV